MKFLVFIFSLTLPMMGFSGQKLCSEPAALQQEVLAVMPGLQRATLLDHELQARLGESQRAHWMATYLDPLDRGEYSSVIGSTEKSYQVAFKNEVIQYVQKLFPGMELIKSSDSHGPPNTFLQDLTFPKAWIVNELFSDGHKPAGSVLWTLSYDAPASAPVHMSYLGKWNIRDNSISEEFSLFIIEGQDIQRFTATSLDQVLAQACEQSKTFKDLQTFR